MNELVFGSSEAEELRAQLLKERRKRVDAEQRLRALEAEIRTVKPGFHIPEIVVSDPARIAKPKKQIDTTPSQDDFLLALHSPAKTSGSIFGHRRTSSGSQPVNAKESSIDTTTSSSPTTKKPGFPEFLTDHLKWLEDNEVIFDEKRAETETAPRTWNDVEEHIKSMEELKKQLEQQKSEIERLTTELAASQRLAESKTRLSNFLEKELSKAQKYADKIRQIILAKNETIRSLLIEKQASSTIEARFELVLRHKCALEVENERQRRELESLRESCARLQNSSTMAREQLDIHATMLADKDLTVAKMAQKLIDLKNRLSSITSVIGRYRALRLYRIYPSAEAQLLVIHDGPSGERRLDVLIGGKNYPHAASTIRTIETVPNTLDRFNIAYISGETENYSSDMRDHLLVELNELLFDDTDTVFGVRNILNGHVAASATSSSNSPKPNRQKSPQKPTDIR